MPLTPEQKDFCAKYLRRGRATRAEGQSVVLQALAAVAVPPEASPRSSGAIRARIAAARSLLDDSTSDSELKQARVDADVAAHLATVALERIAKAREEAAQLRSDVARHVAALEEAERARDELAAKLEERRRRFEAAKPLLARIASDAPSLAPHVRAPAAEAEPIASEASVVRISSARFGVWDEVTGWGTISSSSSTPSPCSRRG